jgi:hypothetical protein
VHFRGKAISPKAPRLGTRQRAPLSLSNTTGDGPLGDWSPPRRSSDYIRVAEKSTSPVHFRGRAISPKAPRPRTGQRAPLSLSNTTGDGPLGDRSPPRRSSDYIRVAEKSTSPVHFRGRAISLKAPCLRTRQRAPLSLSNTTGDGPLGDRSPPRRSSDYIRGTKNQLRGIGPPLADEALARRSFRALREG